MLSREGVSYPVCPSGAFVAGRWTKTNHGCCLHGRAAFHSSQREALPYERVSSDYYATLLRRFVQIFWLLEMPLSVSVAILRDVTFQRTRLGAEDDHNEVAMLHTPVVRATRENGSI